MKALNWRRQQAEYQIVGNSLAEQLLLQNWQLQTCLSLQQVL